MTREETKDQILDVNPSMIILGLGYVTSLIVAIGWLTTFFF